MLTSILRKHGLLAANTALTTCCVFVSVGITYAIWKLFKVPSINYAIITAIICPLVIAPLVIYYYGRLLIRLDNSMRQLETANQELNQSLSRIKELSGLLPICASCKKIRDDKGYWKQLESYIQDHSEAEFSHSICPECKDILYPEFKE